MPSAPHAGEQDGGPRSGAQRDPTPIQRRKRHLPDEIDRQYWPVGPHGQIGSNSSSAFRKYSSSEIGRRRVPDERVVEPIRRVFGQLDVEQRARTHQSPVDRQAIQGLSERGRADVTGWDGYRGQRTRLGPGNRPGPDRRPPGLASAAEQATARWRRLGHGRCGRTGFRSGHRWGTGGGAARRRGRVVIVVTLRGNPRGPAGTPAFGRQDHGNGRSSVDR